MLFNQTNYHHILTNEEIEAWKENERLKILYLNTYICMYVYTLYCHIHLKVEAENINQFHHPFLYRFNFTKFTLQLIYHCDNIIKKKIIN